MTSVTKKSFKEAIENTKGTLTAVANYIGVHFITVWRFTIKDNNKEFCVDLLRMAKKRNVSNASDTIYEYSTMEDENDPKLMALKLKSSEKIVMTQGKDEGWVERTQTEVSGNVSFDSAENLRKIWEEENADPYTDTKKSDT